MSQRFQIEDLVVQDNSGVVFRALDSETNQQVALRRFFPFGAKGGGLDTEEQIDYGIAVKRFAGVSHPALRSVVCGGCDPIDGMPFVATEWVEGTRLQAFIDRRPLKPDEATNLLIQALDVCLFLSEVLEEEAVWVETDPQAIVIGEDGSGRGITFWIAPLRLLENSKRPRSLFSFTTLTERMMCWNGQLVSDQAGGGLGSWLNWLRDAAATTSLREAREKLVASVGVESTALTKYRAHQAARPPIISKKKKKFSKLPMVAIACLSLTALALGGWFLVETHHQSVLSMAAMDGMLTPGTITPLSPDRGNSVEDVNHPVVEMSATAEQTAVNRELKAKELQAEITKRGGVFNSSDHELLLAQDGHQVTVEGILEGIGYSMSKKTMYLQFSKNPTVSNTCGSIRVKGIPADLKEPVLTPLVGKKVCITGKVQVEKINNRPVIIIENRNAIKANE